MANKKTTVSAIAETTQETISSNTRPSGIVVNDAVIQPKKLPLIVVLPPDASKAQIERAKILNAYAYSNPKGWGLKKERLLRELEDLKDAPDPEPADTDKSLSVGTPTPVNILP